MNLSNSINPTWLLNNKRFEKSYDFCKTNPFQSGLMKTIKAIFSKELEAAPKNFDWNVPDRLSAIESFNELTELCPTSDINYLPGWEMRQDTMRYTMQFTPPDVELHCLYGTNIPTVEKLVQKKSAIAGEIPKLVTGDGDGTVNLWSLEV